MRYEFVEKRTDNAIPKPKNAAHSQQPANPQERLAALEARESAVEARVAAIEGARLREVAR